MPANARTRLSEIVRRELEKRSVAPIEMSKEKHFRGMRLSLAKYGRSWDRKRGDAMRLAGVLLSESDQAMQARVCESPATAKTYASAVSCLTKEAEQLRKCSKLQEMAVARLTAVLARCADEARAHNPTIGDQS